LRKKVDFQQKYRQRNQDREFEWHHAGIS
jgi:hypothetical protein